MGALIELHRGISYGVVQPGQPDPSGVPIVRVSDIRGGRIDVSQPLRVSKEIEEKHERTRLRGGELLLTLVGTVGETAVVPEALRGWNTARSVGVIPVRADIGATWVRYVISSAGIQTRIGSRLNTTVQATLNLGDVAALPIPLPPERERSRIIQVIGALDDKIELNHRTNETVESMARALFQSWFVDFDPVRAKMEGRQPAGMDADTAKLFPKRMHSSEEGDAPEGWVASELNSLVTLERGLSYTGAGLADEGMLLVNLGCFTGDGRFRDAKLKYYRGEYRERHLVGAGELVIANTDITQKRLVIGSPAIVPNTAASMLYSHHVYAARRLPETKQHWVPFLFFVLLQPVMRERCAGYATGTTVLALPLDAILRLSFIRPPEAIVRAFGRVIGPIWARMRASDAESASLTALRDTLLPKLLSGELRVPDAERAVADAV